MGLSRTDLTTIATRTGRPVKAAWSDRNAGAMGTVMGVVMHHTGSDQTTPSRAPTLGIVRQGRSDLQNALCNWYIDKDGVIYLITEKIAWHAGQGAWRGVTDGNGHLLGIEAESDGRTWTAETVESFVRLVAEICRYLGVNPADWAVRHGAWALPKGRKTDFSGLNEADFRNRVAAWLNHPNAQEDDLNQDEHNMLAAVYQKLTMPLPLTGRPGADLDDLYGHVLSADAVARQIRDTVAGLAKQGPSAAVNVDASAVADALANNAAFVANLAKAVNDDASRRLAS